MKTEKIFGLRGSILRMVWHLLVVMPCIFFAATVLSSGCSSDKRSVDSSVESKSFYTFRGEVVNIAIFTDTTFLEKQEIIPINSVEVGMGTITVRRLTDGELFRVFVPSRKYLQLPNGYKVNVGVVSYFMSPESLGCETKATAAFLLQ
ncbi:MAG: hypothetical protein Q7R98_02350 [Candidatus Jorgensenbacteria bacterium]|nr:hypothetical protein [Candidatus Jorgensenbacteria bacterium]